MVHRARLCVNGRPAQLAEVRVPTELSSGIPDDATAALPIALLLAMRFGDDLEVEGRIDPDLYARLELIQDYYQAMDPSLQSAEVHVRGLLEPTPPRAAFAGACLSRGVDSLYTCAHGRTAQGSIDCAVFVDGLERIHDAAVRKDEVALARQAAEQLGLPLVVVESPVLRSLTDGIFDWDDAVGAGLAWIAHTLAGGLARFVVPSADSVHSLGPAGSSPVLDPLFSSRRMTIEHADVVATRMGKVSWLVRNRPDLLPLLKVCFMENRADNCGRCRKCLRTMACLRAAGALEQATGFPDVLDLEALAAVDPPHLASVHDYVELRGGAERRGDRELAAAASTVLERTRMNGMLATQAAMPTRKIEHSKALSALLRPTSSGPDTAGPDVEVGTGFGVGQLGLLRAFDRRARRHVYTTTGCSAETLTAELGALVAKGSGAEIPAWILADGRLVTDRYLPPDQTPGAWSRARFCLEPLRSSDWSLAKRCWLGLRRALDAWALPLPPTARVPPWVAPAGYLFAEPGGDRLPLWSGVHPVVSDQLLTWSSLTIERAGYVGACLLGYLAATAPQTGRLGTHTTPLVPWAGTGAVIVDQP